MYTKCMKNKVAVIFFSSLAAILAVVITLRLTVFRKNSTVRSKVIVPVSEDAKKKLAEETNLSGDSVMMTSLIPLLSTETLMSTLVLDFDGDNLDDQIVAVYKAGSDKLYLIVGLYNSTTNSYERAGEIATDISKTRTFSFNAIDMIGNHRNALVYQGVNSKGDSIMKIYLCHKRREVVELDKIGDFQSDGTIFIVQTERSEAYELSQTRGQAFSVWVYSSDKSEEQDSSTAVVSQIQTEYTWDEESGKYVQKRQLKVTGSRLAARELARIQNGNVDTFAEYLNGFWYKTSANGGESYYIYFNYADREIIFLSGDTEGVYSWEPSSLRRSGIYLTVVNSIISSMKRRLDIMLTGVNEVYVHVHEDVGLLIKETNHWDGTYKKMSFQNSFAEEKTQYPHTEYAAAFSKNPEWEDDSGKNYTFSDGNYTLVSSESEEKGLYVLDTVGQFSVIQFRSKQENSSVSNCYAIQFKTTEEIVPAKRRNQKPEVKKVVDKNYIILTPVKLSPETCFAVDGAKITLHKVSK